MPEANIVRHVKRAVIKEEYVAITGDVTEAIILNQMLYWSERVGDYDKFIAEEQKHMTEIGEKAPDYPLFCGWIHKSAAELKDEIMAIDSLKTISRKLQNLVEKNYLLRRNNPKSGYDRKYQYRINLPAIVEALNEKGYALDGYTLPALSHTPINTDNQAAHSICHNDKWNRHYDNSICRDDDLICHSDEAIPETITNTISEITSSSLNPSGVEKKDAAEVTKKKENTECLPEERSAAQAVVDLYNQLCPSYPRVEVITNLRLQAIKGRLIQYVGDMGKFKRTFENAENSSYLKGRSWQPDFDWLIQEDNFAKTLEGKYANKASASCLTANSSAGGPSYSIDEYVRLSMQVVDGQDYSGKKVCG